MSTLELVIGILLLIMALFLIVSILMQSGKSKKLSGTIAGGAETFFGKEKGAAMNKTLSKVTNVVAIIFVVLVFSLLLINAKDTADKEKADASSSAVVSTDASTDTSADASKDSSKDASEDASEEASAAESSEASVAESSEAASAESSEASAA